MNGRVGVRATLYIALIFLCGALTGVVGVTAWNNWTASAKAASRPRSTLHTVDKLTRELSLTSDQTHQLNQILDETHRQYQAREDQIEAVRQQGRDRIRKILTPEQRVKYEQILASIEANRKHPSR